jgi:hypothetical protein
VRADAGVRGDVHRLRLRFVMKDGRVVRNDF